LASSTENGSLSPAARVLELTFDAVVAARAAADPVSLVQQTATSTPICHRELLPRVKRDEARAIWFWHSRLVIAIFPLLLIWAVLRIRRTEQRGRAGWAGFAAWTVAGAIFTFSLLTGFSIGLFLLPVVAAMLYLAVRGAPDFRASLGFVAGVGLTLLVLASINNFSIGWLIPGVVFSVIALASFTTPEQVARRRHDLG
jgi:hypothetical protein